MALNIGSFLVFSLLLLLFFFSYQISAAEVTDLIAEICSKTQHNDLCVSSLRSDNRTSSAGDLDLFTQIIAGLAKSNGSDTFRYIDVLLKQTEEGELKVNLYECQTLYDMGTGSLDSALWILKTTKSYFDVRTKLKEAGDVVVSCDGFFKDPPMESPLAERNELYLNLCSVASSIASFL